MQEMLGQSTCFQFVDYPSHEPNQTNNTAVTADTQQQLIHEYQQDQAQVQSISNQLVTNELGMGGIQGAVVGTDDAMSRRALDLDFW